MYMCACEAVRVYVCVYVCVGKVPVAAMVSMGSTQPISTPNAHYSNNSHGYLIQSLQHSVSQSINQLDGLLACLSQRHLLSKAKI